MAEWTVIFDLRLGHIWRDWAPRQLRQRDLIEALLSADGPGAFVDGAPPEYWETIEEPVTRMAIARFDTEFYRLGFEIHPGRGVIVREMVHFMNPGFN